MQRGQRQAILSGPLYRDKRQWAQTGTHEVPFKYQEALYFVGDEQRCVMFIFHDNFLPLSQLVHVGLFCPVTEPRNQLFAQHQSVIPLSTL